MKGATTRSQRALAEVVSALRANGSRATFFVTGQYYERHPIFVESLVENDQEVGYHGHAHRPLDNVDVLEEDLELSGPGLLRLGVKGFRAPWVRLPPGAAQILVGAGFAYDSSEFAPPGVFWREHGLWRFPVSAMRPGTGRKAIPWGSGIATSWMRWVQPSLYRWFGRRGRPVVSYIHDWQLVPPDQPHSWRRAGLRAIHNFPMLDPLIQLIEKVPMAALEDRMGKPVHDGICRHHLSFDVERMEDS